MVHAATEVGTAQQEYRCSSNKSSRFGYQLNIGFGDPGVPVLFQDGLSIGSQRLTPGPFIGSIRIALGKKVNSQCG
jgi:hypothetical protein